MKWSEMCIHTTNEAVEPISNILHEHGADGIAIEDPLDLVKERDTFFGEIYELNPSDYPEEGVFVKAYLPVNESLSKTVAIMKRKIGELPSLGIDIGKNEITFAEIDEADWATAWKKYYKPVKISDKITITPTWETYTPATDELVIELDPGMAFGTGTHPTTALSIRALEQHLDQCDIVIDVGCGSGVLSIAAAKIGAEKIYAFDLDDVAVKSTGINAGLNNLEHKIAAKQNDLLNQVSKQADIIVSNILAEIIVRFIDDAWHNLKPGGLFITSGIIQSKKDDVIKALEQQHFEIVEMTELDEWVCMTARKTI
jgi:ribosomal protein L11 methyltransferase